MRDKYLHIYPYFLQNLAEALKKAIPAMFSKIHDEFRSNVDDAYKTQDWQLCAAMMSWVGQWVELVVYWQIKCYQINES